MRPFLFAAALCLSNVGFAQDFELDLSEPKVPAEFRPTLALLAVRGDAESQGRAALLEIEVIRLLAANDQFGTVLEPRIVEQKLGEKAGTIATCKDWSCFDQLTRALGAHRALTVVVSKVEGGSTVTLQGFDPQVPDVVNASEPVLDKNEAARFSGMASRTQSAKDKEFVKRAAVLVVGALTKLATPNGKLIIDNVDQTTVVTLDDEQAGVGNVERIVQRGSHTVKVTGAGYLPFEKTVTVEPMKIETVKVALVAKPIERPAVAVKVEPKYPPIYARPGLYVAAAGVGLAIVGFVLGGMATSTQSKAVDANNDGVVDITRAQAKQAQTNALMANVLVGAGAAVAIAGTVWVAVTPPLKQSSEPETEGGGFGVRIGGRF